MPMSHKELESRKPPNSWEGKLERIPFTTEGVTNWVRERYMDQKNRRYKVAIDTTLFSVLQSLLYEYPDDWSEVAKRLTDID